MKIDDVEQCGRFDSMEANYRVWAVIIPDRGGVHTMDDMAVPEIRVYCTERSPTGHVGHETGAWLSNPTGGTVTLYDGQGFTKDLTSGLSNRDVTELIDAVRLGKVIEIDGAEHDFTSGTLCHLHRRILLDGLMGIQGALKEIKLKRLKAGGS